MTKRKSKFPVLAIVFSIIVLIITVSYMIYIESYEAPFRVDNRDLNGTSIIYETFEELGYEVYNDSYELSEEENKNYDFTIVVGVNSVSKFSVLDDKVTNWVIEGGNLVVLTSGDMDIENVSQGLVYKEVESEIDEELDVLLIGHGSISFVNISNIINVAITIEPDHGYELFEKIHGVQEDIATINFNEYYFDENEPGLSLFRDTPMPVKLVLFQMLILIIVYIAYEGRRFGKIQKYYEEEERTENEYIDAVTNLYNKSGNGKEIIKKHEDRSDR